MGLFVVVLLVALGASSVTPSSQEALPRSFVKREAQNSYASSPYYSSEEYYYQYPQRKQAPAEEEEEEPSKVVALYQQLFGKEKEECGIERLSPPIILIAIFLGIIMAVSVGVIPPLTLPALTIPLNGLVLPNIILPDLLQLLLNPGVVQPIVLQVPATGTGRRELDDEVDPYSGNLVSTSFNMLTNHVYEVIESEECAKRLLCEAGKYVEGREMMLSLVDYFVPEVYQNGVGVIKESALEQMNCTSIECSYFDDECYP